MDNYWINIELESEETEVRLNKALQILEKIETYVLDKIVMHRYKGVNLSTTQIIPMVHRWQQTEKEIQGVPQYSIRRVAEQTISYFSKNSNTSEGITTVQKRKINSIQIEGRKIWRKHLALYGMISTSFGNLYLKDSEDKSWRQTILSQSSAEADLIPFLWHSVTVKKEEEDWYLRFNLHKPDSNMGKKARKKLEKFYAQ